LPVRWDAAVVLLSAAAFILLAAAPAALLLALATLPPLFLLDRGTPSGHESTRLNRNGNPGEGQECENMCTSETSEHGYSP